MLKWTSNSSRWVFSDIDGCFPLTKLLSANLLWFHFLCSTDMLVDRDHHLGWSTNILQWGKHLGKYAIVSPASAKRNRWKRDFCRFSFHRKRLIIGTRRAQASQWKHFSFSINEDVGASPPTRMYQRSPRIPSELATRPVLTNRWTIEISDVSNSGDATYAKCSRVRIVRINIYENCSDSFNSLFSEICEDDSVNK